MEITFWGEKKKSNEEMSSSHKMLNYVKYHEEI